MTLPEIRHAAAIIANVEYFGGQFPYGKAVKIETKFANYLGCNYYTARKILRGENKLNPQMVKLLERVKR